MPRIFYAAIFRAGLGQRNILKKGKGAIPTLTRLSVLPSARYGLTVRFGMVLGVSRIVFFTPYYSFTSA